VILVVGSKGNMGQRYSRILDYLGKPNIGVDVDTSSNVIDELYDACQGVIIASPTALHIEHLLRFSKLNKPVICEKPFTKDISKLRNICEVYKRKSITMIYQYSELVHRDQEGSSHYDYFRHGGDSLPWDCIQILGLARGPVYLREKSPIWDCVINNQVLSIQNMDKAYIKNIERWLSGQSMSTQEIIDIHSRVVEYEKSGS